LKGFCNFPSILLSYP